MNPTNPSRRQFLRRSGATALSISVVDLIPVIAQAAHPNCFAYLEGDKHCKAAGDKDGNCGHGQPFGGLDEDQGCTPRTATAAGESDGRCNKQLDGGGRAADGHCNPAVNNPGNSDYDSSRSYVV